MDAKKLTPEMALIRLRFVWAMSVVMIPVFVAFLIFSGWSVSSNQPSAFNMDYVQIGLWGGTALLILIGYFARMQIYKRHWQGDVITPEGYVSGNRLFISLLELPMVATMVLIFMRGQMMALVWPGAIAILVLLINFPTGKPMRSAQSQYDTVARD